MIRNYFFALVAFVLFCSPLLSQSKSFVYYSNVNTAEHFVLERKYAQADSCFKISFHIAGEQGYNTDYITAALNSLSLQDTALTNTYLRCFAKRGGDFNMLKNRFNNVMLENNATLLYNYINNKHNKWLKKDLQHLYKNYSKTVNLKLIRKINRMYFVDQYIARAWHTSLLSSRAQTRIMNKIDHKHAKKLLKICQQYGYWPGFDLLGEFRKYDKYRLAKIDILLRHFSKDDLSELEPYIISSIENLTYYPTLWASCVDYLSLKEPTYNRQTQEYEMKQVYGMLSENVNGKQTILPFGKMSEMELNRKKLYLNNIEDYIRIKKIEGLPNKEFIPIKLKEKSH